MSYYDRRKTKRYLNRLTKKLGRYRYFEDCNYHIARVVGIQFYSQDLYGSGVDGISIFTDKPTSCSLMHCGVVAIPEKEAMERQSYFRAHGFDDYLRKYVYRPMSDEEWQKVVASNHEWRSTWRNGEI